MEHTEVRRGQKRLHSSKVPDPLSVMKDCLYVYCSTCTGSCTSIFFPLFLFPTHPKHFDQDHHLSLEESMWMRRNRLSLLLQIQIEFIPTENESPLSSLSFLTSAFSNQLLSSSVRSSASASSLRRPIDGQQGGREEEREREREGGILIKRRDKEERNKG